MIKAIYLFKSSKTKMYHGSKSLPQTPSVRSKPCLQELNFNPGLFQASHMVQGSTHRQKKGESGREEGGRERGRREEPSEAMRFKDLLAELGINVSSTHEIHACF